jgi:hypothetical protein
MQFRELLSVKEASALSYLLLHDLKKSVTGQGTRAGKFIKYV